MIGVCTALTCIVLTANMFLVLSTIVENLSGTTLAITSVFLSLGGIVYLASLAYALVFVMPVVSRLLSSSVLFAGGWFLV